MSDMCTWRGLGQCLPLSLCFLTCSGLAQTINTHMQGEAAGIGGDCGPLGHLCASWPGAPASQPRSGGPAGAGAQCLPRS